MKNLLKKPKLLKTNEHRETWYSDTEKTVRKYTLEDVLEKIRLILQESHRLSDLQECLHNAEVFAASFSQKLTLKELNEIVERAL